MSDKNSVTCIVIGLNEWDRYTKPMLESALANDPDLNLVCVDNGSDIPYPQMEGVKMLRSKKLSYSGGINFGIRLAEPSDWYVIINNDTFIHKPISKRIEKLKQDALYGFYLEPKDKYRLFMWNYLCGWCLIASKAVLSTLGEFDEKCTPMFFEDADYSARALKAGYTLEVLDRVDWGLQHLEDERKVERKAYIKGNMKQRLAIKDYVRRKHGIF